MQENEEGHMNDSPVTCEDWGHNCLQSKILAITGLMLVCMQFWGGSVGEQSMISTMYYVRNFGGNNQESELKLQFLENISFLLE